MENNQSYAEDYIRIRKNYHAAQVIADEAEAQSVKKGYWFLNYEKVIFERREVIPNEVSMIIPKEFGIMTRKVAEAKYPGKDAPDYIYTNEDSKINLTYSLSVDLIDNEEVDSVKKQIMEQVVRLHPDSGVVSDSLEVGGKVVSYFSLTVPVLDGNLFQLMYFTEIHNNLLIGGFSCSEYDKKVWTPAVMEMLETIERV